MNAATKGEKLSQPPYIFTYKNVAWVRHRDIHVLTIGTYTYTSDQRFQTTHHKDTDEWTLHIKWAQPRDAGTYECQISSVPIRSYFVELSVNNNREEIRMNYQAPPW
uniref:Uncharacterized protein n=1 Tax=Phlebotomus papatasi TaxID=29031 RepID=A0A1B0DI79_PHLPP